MLSITKFGSGWNDMIDIMDEELAIYAVKLKIENYALVPDEYAKRFWSNHLNK